MARMGASTAARTILICGRSCFKDLLGITERATCTRQARFNDPAGGIITPIDNLRPFRSRLADSAPLNQRTRHFNAAANYPFFVRCIALGGSRPRRSSRRRRSRLCISGGRQHQCRCHPYSKVHCHRHDAPPIFGFIHHRCRSDRPHRPYRIRSCAAHCHCRAR